MRAIIIVASLVLALLTSAWGNDSTSPAPDNPQVATADRLLPACQQFDQLPSPSVTFFMAYDEGKCVGIILGLDEAADDVCIPNGVMVDQKVRAAIQYIGQRPERLNEPFARLAHEALKAAWPCKH
jgi:hypothetical protein